MMDILQIRNTPLKMDVHILTILNCMMKSDLTDQKILLMVVMLMKKELRKLLII